MAEHTILISPARPGRFDARLADSSAFLVEGTRTPLGDCARALLAGGLADPADTIALRHVGSDRVFLRSPVGVLAELTEVT
jgi:hypothetical protein